LEETGRIILRRNKYVFFILVMTGIHKSYILCRQSQEKARKACAKRASVSPSIILKRIFFI
jgi:hypothetical protein